MPVPILHFLFCNNRNSILLPCHSKTLFHNTHIFYVFLFSFLSLPTPDLAVCYILFYVLSTRTAAWLHFSEQYFCRPEFTIYSFPHHSHISVLPIGLFVGILLYLRNAISLQEGHLFARGPPSNEQPQSIQVLTCITFCALRIAAHSGQYRASSPPLKGLPHSRQTFIVRLILSGALPLRHTIYYSLFYSFCYW